MHPALVGILSGVAVLLIGELLRLLIRSLQSSTFTDVERKYIDDRIEHKFRNFETKCDVKYVHKKRPRFGED